MYKAYVFDFDYTLADSEKGIVMCFEMLLADEGYPPVSKDRIRATIGKTMYDSTAILTGETNSSRIHELIEFYRRRYSDTYMTANTRLYAETIPCLRRLKQKQVLIGIVSTKTRARINQTLQKDNITNLIDCVIGMEDVSEAKPSPQGLNQIKERYSLRNKEILYIGDSLIDAETAKNGQVDFTAVLTGVTGAEAFASWPHVQIIKTLAELD